MLTSASPAGSELPLATTARRAPPLCVQTLSLAGHSILSLAVSLRHLYVGTQRSCIHVWDLQTFQQAAVLVGHTGSVFCLKLPLLDQSTLFSSSGDGTVRGWSTTTHTCLYCIHASADAGDILSLAYSARGQTLYLGCRNTSIQWFNLDAKGLIPGHELQAAIRARSSSRFFGAADGTSHHEDAFRRQQSGVEQYVILPGSVYPHSHHGFIFSLVLGKLPGFTDEILISGAGDGIIKMWKVLEDRIELFRQFPGRICNIFGLTPCNDLLYAGTQGGDMVVWDMQTSQRIRSIPAHGGDVVSLVSHGSSVYSAAADGLIKKWSDDFECIYGVDCHEGIASSLIVTDRYLIGGDNCGNVKLWDIHNAHALEQNRGVEAAVDPLFQSLYQWISIPSISGDPRHFQDCCKCAEYLHSLLVQLGANCKMLPGQEGRNPIVFAQFRSNVDVVAGGPLSGAAVYKCEHPNVLVYGHYDVVPTDNSGWDSPPFMLTGKNGYLYGRGVSDDKGPLLAVIFAVSELLQQRRLELNVSFLIEGEEECGSVGFFEAVEQNQEMIGDPDLIFLSDSHWLGENRPCLTYGLRGVIRAQIHISSNSCDTHSGVAGGVVSEPVMQIAKVLAGMTSSDDNKVLIPGFYSSVRPINAYEASLLEQLVIASDIKDAEKIGAYRRKLKTMWREPTFTVHSIRSSGPLHDTVIPRKVSAHVSMRTVPDQDCSEIADAFRAHVLKLFAELKSDNSIEVVVGHTADWWLGDPVNRFFTAAKEAICEEWGVEPLFIREGGSISAVRWLEKKFGTVALNLPMGQSTDHTHLGNERIRVQNLYLGKNVVKSFFSKLTS